MKTHSEIGFFTENTSVIVASLHGATRFPVMMDKIYNTVFAIVLVLTSVYVHGEDPPEVNESPRPVRDDDATTTSSVRFTWPAAAGRFTGYEIHNINEATNSSIQQIKLPREGPLEAVFTSSLSAGMAIRVCLYTYSNPGLSLLSCVNSGTRPDRPRNAQHAINSPGTDFVSIAWKPPRNGGVDKYRLKIIDETSTDGPQTTTTFTSYGYDMLQSCSQYVVEIRTLFRGLTSDNINFRFATKPEPPTDLHILWRSATSLDVTWFEPSSSCGGYEIAYSAYPATDFIVFSTNETYYTLENLLPNTQYSIRVQTVGLGVHSTGISIDAYTRPTSPSNITISQTRDGRVLGGWLSQNSTASYEYSFTRLDSFLPELNETVTMVRETRRLSLDTPGADYLFCVAAVVSMPRVSRSEESCIVFTSEPLPPELRCENMDGIVTLHITKVQGVADNYTVRCSGPSCPGFDDIVTADDDDMMMEYSGFDANATYIFTVTASSSGVSSREAQATCSITTADVPDEKKTSNAGLIAGVVCAFVALVALVFIIAVCIRTRRQNNDSGQHMSTPSTSSRPQQSRDGGPETNNQYEELSVRHKYQTSNEYTQPNIPPRRSEPISGTNEGFIGEQPPIYEPVYIEPMTEEDEDYTRLNKDV